MTQMVLLSVNMNSSVGTDTFGHKMLAGCGKYLENLVRSRLGVKARSVELNVSQRCSCISDFCHRPEGSHNCRKVWCSAALNGETGKMVSFIARQTLKVIIRWYADLRCQRNLQ